MFELENGMTLGEGHPILGHECWLCQGAFRLGESIRFVVVGAVQGEFDSGDQLVAPARAAHIKGMCTGPMTLRCSCCLHEESFEFLVKAFADGWDEPDHLPTWPVSCPLCPGVYATGLCDHGAAHERWNRHGRPESLSHSVSAGDTPDFPDIDIAQAA